jgi:hypothetical protein
MPLTKLQFRPGVNRETTSYTNEGGWFDSNNVRFRFGLPEKIGGWAKAASASFLGVCRALHTWVTLEGTPFTGVGTTVKYYIKEGDAYYDITPLRNTTAAGDVTFAAVNTESTLTVTDAGHGAVVDDFVTFAGATTLGGVITAGVLNQEYQITEVVNDNSYKIQARTAGTSIQSITVDGQLSPTLVPANGSDTGNGGASTIGYYQINSGLTISVPGSGWGAGTWGRSTWGSSTDVTAVTNDLRVYTQDNFGEDLIFNVRDGNIYYWDTSADNLGTDRAVPLTAVLGGALWVSGTSYTVGAKVYSPVNYHSYECIINVSGTTDPSADAANWLQISDATTPTKAKQVVVSDRDRHILVFGTDSETAIGTMDPLLIRFSSQESVTTWTATVDNTAGDLRVGAGSEIVCAVETRQQVLVFTDVSLHAMQFLGPPFTFGIDQISENITIAGPLAAKAVDDAVFWMGVEEFYIYTGQVQKLPCSVRSYVFNDFNLEQKELVTASLNSSFSEIWWFYPSSDATEIDKYVVYNYQEQVWYYGSMVRTYWLDRGVNDYPVAAGTDGYLYNQEFGLNDGSTSPPSAIPSYIESSQLSIGDGEDFVFLSRLIPDITFDASVDPTPTVNMTLQTRNYPGGQYLQTNASAVTQSATTPVEQFTNEAYIRLRGRAFALKIDSSMTDIQWRLGSPRVDVRPDGRQ